MPNNIEDKEFLKLLAQIEKDYGEGTVVGGGAARQKRDVISTGSLSLDLATGIGGLARGAIVEVAGWESSGKSTICLNTIANAQRGGLRALLVDAENSFDAHYARALGVDVDSLLIVQMDGEGAEKCYNVAERFIRSGKIGVVVFDSQTALLPKKVIEGESGDSNLGLHARLMSATVPKIMTACAEHNVLGIYVSQFREKIGVMFGSPVTTNGGHALKFYAHMRLEVSKSVQKEDGVAHHNKTKVKVIKNKMAVPFKEAEFDILWGIGVDWQKEALEVASALGIVEKRGAYYHYDGNCLGQGLQAARATLSDNEGLAEELRRKIIVRVEEAAQ